MLVETHFTAPLTLSRRLYIWAETNSMRMPALPLLVSSRMEPVLFQVRERLHRAMMKAPKQPIALASVGVT